MNKQFRKILPIGLVENDRLQVIAVSDEVAERTGLFRTRLETHAHAHVWGEVRSSNEPDSFPFSPDSPIRAQGSRVILTVYVFGVPFPAVTTMGIEFGPTARRILGEGTPEIAGEPLIVNAAVESSTVAVIVVSTVVFGTATS